MSIYPLKFQAAAEIYLQFFCY